MSQQERHEAVLRRRQQIHELHVGGMTHAAIGRQLGISKERVRQLHAAHKRSLERGSPDRAELSTRARNVLMMGRHAAGFGEWDERSRRLVKIAARYSRKELLGELNAGPATVEEIAT